MTTPVTVREEPSPHTPTEALLWEGGEKGDDAQVRRPAIMSHQPFARGASKVTAFR